MSIHALQGTELKKLLEAAKQEPIFFGFNPGKNTNEVFLTLHKTKPAKTLGKAAKDGGKGEKHTYGTAELIDKTLRLKCERELPQLSKSLKKYLLAQQLVFNIEVMDASGNLLESDTGEEVPGALDAADGKAPNGISAANTSSPGEAQALQARIKQLEAIKAPALVERLKTQVLQKALELVAKSNFNDAGKLLDGLEAKLLIGEAQASRVDPMRLQTLKARMQKLETTEVPPMLDGLKAKTLKKVRELLVNGKLDDAGKLLDALAAKAVQKEKEVKAVFGEAQSSPPPRPSKPAPTERPGAAARSDKSTEKAAKAAFGEARSSDQAGKPAAANSAQDSAPAGGKLTVEGVDFSDGKKMMDYVIKFGEEVQALINLIDHKSPAGANKKWDDHRKKCEKLKNDSFNVEGDRMSAYEKGGAKEISAAHANYLDMIKQKRTLAKDLKEIWQKDQRQRLDAELKNNNSPSTASMAAAFGDEFLEMAQMAEVQAKKKGLDPYAAAKGGLKEPMEMGEIAAIYGYSTQDYTKVNGLLRGKKDPDVDPSSYMSYIEACKKGLAKLPPYKGEAVRCDKTASYFLKEILASGKRTEKAFMSTGTVKIPGFGDVVTRITKVKSGKNISAFSLHDKEEEVLFPPGSVFKFVKFVGPDNTTIKDYRKLGAIVDEKTDKGEFFFEQVR